MEDLPVEFAHQFRDTVRRDRRRRHVLAFGKGGSVAVDRGGTGEDDTTNSGVARGQEDIQGAIDVNVIGFGRVLNRAGDGGARGKMQDNFGSAARTIERGAIGDRTDDQINLAAHSGEIGFATRGKVVEHGHGVAAADQFVHRIRADESGAARDQVANESSGADLGLGAGPQQRARPFSGELQYSVYPKRRHARARRASRNVQPGASGFLRIEYNGTR